MGELVNANHASSVRVQKKRDHGEAVDRVCRGSVSRLASGDLLVHPEARSLAWQELLLFSGNA